MREERKNDFLKKEARRSPEFPALMQSILSYVLQNAREKTNNEKEELVFCSVEREAEMEVSEFVSCVGNGLDP